PGTLGDERCLEIVVGDGAPVVQALGELERALDVLARSFPVALAPVTAGAPTESVRAEPIGREAGALGEIECLAQERDCGGDRRKLVAADSDAVQHLGPVDIAE